MNILNVIGVWLLVSGFIYSFYLQYRAAVYGERRFVFHAGDVAASLALAMIPMAIFFLIIHGN